MKGQMRLFLEGIMFILILVLFIMVIMEGYNVYVKRYTPIHGVITCWYDDNKNITTHGFGNKLFGYDEYDVDTRMLQVGNKKYYCNSVEITELEG